VEAKMREIGVGTIATVSGRYWAMDRDNRWDRVKKAYDALAFADGPRFDSAERAITWYYENPRERSMNGDEFVTPSIITDDDGRPRAVVQNGDSIIFYNYRGDRPRELTKAFVLPDFTGFERGPKGSNATSQYSPKVAARFSDLKKTPENLLLWFHHVPWDHRLSSGRTVWDELVLHYTHGVEVVSQMRVSWAAQQGRVDAERFAQVAAFLAIQEREAQWWRDACIAYFQSLSQRPLPAGVAPPAQPLEYYKSLKFPYAPGRG